MRIAVLVNLKENAPKWEGMPDDKWDDLDSPRTPQAICEALRGAGHEAEYFEANILPPFNLIERLTDYRPDLCFNISESHFGNARESQIPAVLEMLRIPYTGSQPLALALALDKPMTKRVLHYHGLPTPEFQTFERADEPIHAEMLNGDGDLRFPLFVKPSAEGTSMGVSEESIVRSVGELRDQVGKQLGRYQQPILVERFIQGREVMIGLVGNVSPMDAHLLRSGRIPHSLTFMPALEVDISAYGDDHPGIYTSAMKDVPNLDNYHYLCPAPLADDLLYDLQLLTARVFHVTDCKDVARVDIRLDASDGNKPYVLEINPLPGLNPGFSDLCLQALALGWPHERLVNTIVDQAAARYGLRERRLAQQVVA